MEERDNDEEGKIFHQLFLKFEMYSCRLTNEETQMLT
jgi:hypothetical protein